MAELDEILAGETSERPSLRSFLKALPGEESSSWSGGMKARSS